MLRSIINRNVKINILKKNNRFIKCRKYFSTNHISDNLKSTMDHEVYILMEHLYEKTKHFIISDVTKIEAIKNLLLEKETI
jgi:ATP-dependent Zn protease